jgi:signal transduction histidine kinase
MNLNAFIVENEPMLRLVAGKQINIVTDIDPELAMVSVDPGQLQQVLLNLTLNARDAMDMQGKLTIRTQNVEVDAESARMTDVRPGTYVQLEIIDTGVGMTEEVRSRLFEPFFTTKPPGKGTGLGLSTVYGIIKQSGGNISVGSAPGQGATFRVLLPVAQVSDTSFKSSDAESGGMK